MEKTMRTTIGLQVLLCSCHFNFVSDSRREESLAENTPASEKGLPPQEPAPGSDDFQLKD